MSTNALLRFSPTPYQLERLSAVIESLNEYRYDFMALKQMYPGVLKDSTDKLLNWVTALKKDCQADEVIIVMNSLEELRRCLHEYHRLIILSMPAIAVTLCHTTMQAEREVFEIIRLLKLKLIEKVR